MYHLQKLTKLFLGSRSKGSSRADFSTRFREPGFSPTWACILMSTHQDEALEGLERLVCQLNPPSKLFVFTGSDVTKRSLQRLEALLSSSASTSLCWEKSSSSDQQEALARRWGDGFAKIVDLDEDTEAREEYEGSLNEDVLFGPLSLCLIPDAPHYLLFDPSWRFKVPLLSLYQSCLDSGDLVRGIPLTEGLAELPEVPDEFEEEEWEDEEPSPWEGLIFVNRAKLASLFAPLREDLARRIEASHAAKSVQSVSAKKQREDPAKQAKLVKISEHILRSWPFDASQPLHEQAFAFLQAVTTASLRWNSLVLPAFRPRNFATVESTEEFFEALATLSTGQLVPP